MPRKKINWRRVRAANARHATQTRVEAHKKQGGGCSGMIREVEPMPDQVSENNQSTEKFKIFRFFEKNIL